MKKFLLSSMLVLTVATCSVSPAFAQMFCAPTQLLMEQLKQDHNESPVGMGVVAGNRGIFQILASPKGGWTALYIRTDGIACVVAGGENWEQIDMELLEEGPVS